MGTGYTRNDTGNNIADGNVIDAADLDGEFDAIQAAFNASTGHTHDGTTGEGPQIDTPGLADDAVTPAKLDETGSYTVAGMTNTGTLYVDDITESTATAGVTIDGVVLKDGGATVTADVNFGDNDKAIFGAGSDLEIWHSSNNSFIDQNGVGSLYLRNFTDDADIFLQTDDGSGGVTTYIKCGGTAGDVSLRHYGSERLSTTSTGINVTGLTETDTFQIGSAFSLPTGHTFAMNGLLAQTSSPTNVRNTFNAISLGNECSWLTGNAKWVDNFSSGYATTTGNTQYITNDNSYSNAAGLLKFHGNGGQWQFYSVDTPSGTAADTDIDWSSSQILSMGQSGADFNSGQTSVMDFRVRSANQSNALFVDAGTDKVGINNGNPVVELEAIGDIIATNVGMSSGMLGFSGFGTYNNSTAVETIDGLYLRKGGTNNSSVGIAFGNAGGDSYYVGARIKHLRSDANSEGHLVFETKGDNSINTTVERMRITADGNVGIGVTTPQNKLQINTTGAGTPYIGFDQIADNPYMEQQRWSGTGTAYHGTRIKNVQSSIIFENTGVTAQDVGSQTFTERLRIDGAGNFIFNELSNDKDFRVESDGNSHMLYVDGGNNKVTVGGSTTRQGLNVVGKFAVHHNDNTTTAGWEVDTDVSKTWLTQNLYYDAGWNCYDGTYGGSMIAMAEGKVDFYGFSSVGTDNATVSTLPLSISLATGNSGTTVFNQNSYDMDFRVESDGNTHMLFVDGGTSQISIYGSAWDTNPLSTSLQIQGNLVQSNDSTYARNTFTAMSWSGHCSWLAGNAYRNSNAKSGGQPLGVTGQAKFLEDLNQYGNSAGMLQFNANGAIWEFLYAGITTGQGTGQDDDIDWSNGRLLTMGPNIVVFNEDGTNRDFRIESDANSNMIFADASRGQVNINCSSNTALSETGLFVQKPASNKASMCIANQDSAAHTWLNYTDGNNYFTADTSEGDGSQYFRRYSSGGTYTKDVHIRGTNGYVGFGVENPTIRIHLAGGAVTSGNTGIAAAWNVHSDYRLKENVSNITSAIDTVKLLRPVNFSWIEEAEAEATTQGFIAHEIQEQLPFTVLGEKDAVDEDGNIISQAADYSKVVPVLTAALQEALAKIEDLETRIAALETAS